MPNNGFNGSTLTFGNLIAKIVELSRKASAARVDVTGSDDAEDLFELGTINNQFDVTVVGSPNIAMGDKNTLSIVLSTAKALPTTAAKYQVFDINDGGRKNGEITTRITFLKAGTQT